MIYFDNSATTRVDSDIALVAAEAMTKNFGNPSSLHYVGVQAYQALNVARNQIAKMWGQRLTVLCLPLAARKATI